jgi:hypothetical protein
VLAVEQRAGDSARPEVICAAMSRSVPAPQPRSSTTAPGSIRPSSQWLATPAKLSTVAFGTRASSGSGYASSWAHARPVGKMKSCS